MRNVDTGEAMHVQGQGAYGRSPSSLLRCEPKIALENRAEKKGHKVEELQVISNGPTDAQSKLCLRDCGPIRS